MLLTTFTPSQITVVSAVWAVTGCARPSEVPSVVSNPPTFTVPAEARVAAEGGTPGEQYAALRANAQRAMRSDDLSMPSFYFSCAVWTDTPGGSGVRTDSIVERIGDRWAILLLNNHGVPFCVVGGSYCLVADPERPGEWLLYKDLCPVFDWHRTGADVHFECGCTKTADKRRLNLDLASLLPLPGQEPDTIAGPPARRLFNFHEGGAMVRVLGNVEDPLHPHLLGVEYKRLDGQLIAVRDITVGRRPPVRFVELTDADFVAAGLIVNNDDTSRTGQVPSLFPAAWVDDPTYRSTLDRLRGLIRRQMVEPRA
jgi:hypothetical protein